MQKLYSSAMCCIFPCLCWITMCATGGRYWHWAWCHRGRFLSRYCHGANPTDWLESFALFYCFILIYAYKQTLCTASANVLAPKWLFVLYTHRRQQKERMAKAVWKASRCHSVGVKNDAPLMLWWSVWTGAVTQVSVCTSSTHSLSEAFGCAVKTKKV